MQASCGSSFNTYAKKKKNFFLLQISAPQDAAMLIRSLAMKSRKMLAHDVMYTITLDARFKIAALTAVFPRLSNVEV